MSPSALKRMANTFRKVFITSLVPVEYGVQVRVVVHLHLLVHFHVLATGSNVIQQLIDGRSQVDSLREEHIKFLGALVVMLLRYISTIYLNLHMVDLQIQDRQAVDGPCR